MHRLTYRTTARIVHRLPFLTGKLAESVAGRRGACDRWVAWADRYRDVVEPRRVAPFVWLHAPSVGEVMAALPVIHRLRRAHEGLRCVMTYTSPSVVDWTFDGIDHADYLPLDEPSLIEPVADVLRPDLLLFARGDLWPELVDAIVDRKIPVAVSGATLSPSSGRLRWPARAVLGRAAAAVTYLGAVTLGDAGRWRRLGARPETIHVTGDPRQDHVLERAVDGEVATRVRAWGAGAPLLVAGSVERADEAPLADALAEVLPTTGARALLVPHDPSRNGAPLTTRLRAAGLAVGASLLETDLPPEPVVVVGRRGVLFESYVAGDVAFVGGGYRRHGVHSVIEPAAFGLPTVFGPCWRPDRDAARLLAAGGAAAPDDPPGLTSILRRWLTDAGARWEAGSAARRTLCGGAATADAAGIGELLRERRGKTP